MCGLLSGEYKVGHMSKKTLGLLGVADETIIFMKGLHSYVFNRSKGSEFEVIKLIRIYTNQLCEDYDFDIEELDICGNKCSFVRALNDIFWQAVENRPCTFYLPRDLHNFVLNGLIEHIRIIEIAWNRSSGRFQRALDTYLIKK